MLVASFAMPSFFTSQPLDSHLQAMQSQTKDKSRHECHSCLASTGFCMAVWAATGEHTAIKPFLTSECSGLVSDTVSWLSSHVLQALFYI